MSVFGMVKGMAGFGVAAAALVGWLWVKGLMDTNKQQTESITTLTTQKGVLTRDKQQLQGEKMAAQVASNIYAARLERLNKENQANDKKRQQYEQESSELRKKLNTALLQSTCAGEPVPDDAIRMQQQAIAEHNRKYSD